MPEDDDNTFANGATPVESGDNQRAADASLLKGGKHRQWRKRHGSKVSTVSLNGQPAEQDVPNDAAVGFRHQRDEAVVTLAEAPNDVSFVRSPERFQIYPPDGLNVVGPLWADRERHQMHG